MIRSIVKLRIQNFAHESKSKKKIHASTRNATENPLKTQTLLLACLLVARCSLYDLDNGSRIPHDDAENARRRFGKVSQSMGPAASSIFYRKASHKRSLILSHCLPKHS